MVRATTEFRRLNRWHLKSTSFSLAGMYADLGGRGITLKDFYVNFHLEISFYNLTDLCSLVSGQPSYIQNSGVGFAKMYWNNNVNALHFFLKLTGVKIRTHELCSKQQRATVNDRSGN